MSYAKTYSAQTSMLDAHIVTVEVDTSRGLHNFSIVGLPDKAVEEARDRIAAAIKNSGLQSPKEKNQKVVISLAPANLKKEGSFFDLAMALAYLLAVKETEFSPEKKLFLGELSLEGALRPVRGILPLVREARAKGFSEVFVPEENTREAALIGGVAVYGVSGLKDILLHLDKKSNVFIERSPKTAVLKRRAAPAIDLEDIRGQESAKRGLEIAAAGGHNIAMYGPPGTGKTMLARALAGILPPLSFDEMLEVTGIHSVAGGLSEDIVTSAPFRSPHHTASYVSLVGGGAAPRPGEITLAHRGVLFLDEFPEFDRRVLEALRQPLEDRVISISRAKGSALFPADFILVAAMNPCPCGNFGSDRVCVCPPAHLERYRRKLSGPIIDRIDIWVDVLSLDHKKLSQKSPRGEASSFVRGRVEEARRRAQARFKNARHLRANSALGVKDLKRFAPLSGDVEEELQEAARRLDLSARSYHKTIKLARTIADLEGKETIEKNHLLEALQYRPKKLYTA